jgi:hypothetical protein
MRACWLHPLIGSCIRSPIKSAFIEACRITSVPCPPSCAAGLAYATCARLLVGSEAGVTNQVRSVACMLTLGLYRLLLKECSCPLFVPEVGLCLPGVQGKKLAAMEASQKRELESFGHKRQQLVGDVQQVCVCWQVWSAIGTQLLHAKALAGDDASFLASMLVHGFFPTVGLCAVAFLVPPLAPSCRVVTCRPEP